MGKHLVERQTTGIGRFLRVCRNVLITFLIVCILLGGAVYALARFTEIPFISYWRDIYIETAMTTMTHQWLATKFFPDDMIQSVLDESQKQLDNAAVDQTSAAGYERTSIDSFNALAALFPELDPDTIPEQMKADSSLDISDAAGLGIKTKAGDPVWGIDWQNGILIVEVSGDQFCGKLAIIHDSAQLDLVVNQNTERGSQIAELGEESGAVLAINASGFDDPDGSGDGLDPTGLILKDGIILNKAIGGNYHIIGLDKDHNLLVGRQLDLSEMVDAVEFYPCIVLDGKSNADGTLGMGLQPRTVLGQASDGSILMLIIDGRQPGHSIGATVAECADILLNYDCWVAQNLDGGSSSVMWYKGQLITKSSSPAQGGRYLPDAWVILPSSDINP